MSFDTDFLANEAFIRRAAVVAGPFMLKGSFVTRQYFADPTLRQPNDLDWTYLGSLAEVEQARQVFNDWVIQITELPMDDGIHFRSFREDAFWRMIDYAMDDDFPTVNTDLRYELADGSLAVITLDISFNLPMAVPSVPLHYQPAQGAAFPVSHTTPLALQVAWKLHQTLVRPRFKDLFDLLHLLAHPGFTPEVRQQALRSLAEECRADGTDPARLSGLLAGHLQPLFAASTGRGADWDYWRHGRITAADRARFGGLSLGSYFADQAGAITNPDLLPATLPDFEQALRTAFVQAGFDAPAVPAATPPTPPDTPAKIGLLDSLRRFFS